MKRSLPMSRTLDSLSEYAPKSNTPSSSSSGYGSQAVSITNLSSDDSMSIKSISVDETPDLESKMNDLHKVTYINVSNELAVTVCSLTIYYKRLMIVFYGINYLFYFRDCPMTILSKKMQSMKKAQTI